MQNIFSYKILIKQSFFNLFNRNVFQTICCDFFSVRCQQKISTPTCISVSIDNEINLKRKFTMKNSQFVKLSYFLKLNRYFFTCNFSQTFFLGFKTASGSPSSYPSMTILSPGFASAGGLKGSTALAGSSLTN